MLEKSEPAIKRNWQKQGTQDENKKHSTLCIGHNCPQTNTNNVSKTTVLLQTTAEIVIYITTQNSEGKDT